MKRKLLAALSAAVIAVTAASPVLPAMADETNPTVVLDGRDVYFADQKPVIVDDRTLVPARAVFEAMGATVVWTEESQTVYIRSSDNLKRIYLTINSDTMKVDTIVGVSLVASEDDIQEELITLDVPAQIINDRTMVPLRAISEALDCTVEWDGDLYEVIITTTSTEAAATETPTETPSTSTSTSTSSGTSSSGTSSSTSSSTSTDAEATEAPSTSSSTSSDLPTMYITTDTTTAAAGEEVTVYVNIANAPFDQGTNISIATATVYYDSTIFEVEDIVMLADGEEIPSGSMLGGYNETFQDDSVKATYVLYDTSAGATADGAVMAIKFKSLNGEKGTFQLSSRMVELPNGLYTEDTSFGMCTETAGETLYFVDTDELYIDRTIITING